MNSIPCRVLRTIGLAAALAASPAIAQDTFNAPRGQQFVDRLPDLADRRPLPHLALTRCNRPHRYSLAHRPNAPSR